MTAQRFTWDRKICQEFESPDKKVNVWAPASIFLSAALTAPVKPLLLSRLLYHGGLFFKPWDNKLKLFCPGIFFPQAEKQQTNKINNCPLATKLREKYLSTAKERWTLVNMEGLVEHRWRRLHPWSFLQNCRELGLSESLLPALATAYPLLLTHLVNFRKLPQTP